MDTYQALRYARAWHEHPEDGITVDFNKPYPAGGEPIPDCRLLTPDTDAAAWKKKYEALLADLRSVIKKCDDGCILCSHYHKCQEEKCPEFKTGLAIVDENGNEFPNLKCTCMDMDWGTCSMVENTPCKDCDFQNHWEWRGIQECKMAAIPPKTNIDGLSLLRKI